MNSTNASRTLRLAFLRPPLQGLHVYQAQVLKQPVRPDKRLDAAACALFKLRGVDEVGRARMMQYRVPVASVLLTALAACASQEPAPILYADAPDTTRSARLAAVIQQFCIAPLPELRAMQGAFTASGWQAPAPDIAPNAPRERLFGAPIDEREGQIGDLAVSVGLYRASDESGELITCAVETANIDTAALVSMLQQRGHIESAPVVDLSAPPTTLRAWYIVSRPELGARYTLALETNDQTGRVLVTISD